MKKVLVIGYISRYHPGSGDRVPGLVKHLPEFGWQPIVLTKPLPETLDLGCKIIETPYRNVLEPWLRLFRLNPNESVKEQVNKRFGITSSGKSLRRSFVHFILTRIREIVDYPDLERGWKPFALRAGSELLQREAIDAVISTSPPVSSHLIAKELKVKHKIAWIADFPHLWSQDNSYPYSSLRRLIDKRLELRTLSQADALVTVSEPFAAKLRALHKGKLIYTITHGFDPAEMNTLPGNLTKKFTITYTGSLNPRLREPSKLFVALQALISQGIMDPNEVEVRFYGPRAEWLNREIEQYGLSGIVKQYGAVSQQVAWEKQKESQLLLILKWQDPQEPGVHSLKIFEYLASKRPILAVGGYHDVVNTVLDETGAGICAMTVEDVTNALRNLYQEYKLKGEIAWHGAESKIDRYSHREMAKKFSQILDQLT